MFSSKLVRLEHTVDGSAVTGAGESIVVDDPSTGEVIASFDGVSAEQLDDAVDAARRAFPAWSTRPPAERAEALHRFAAALESRREAFVSVIVAEAGTPITLTRPAQVERAFVHMRWFADMADHDWTEDLGPAPDGASASIIGYRPMGVVAALTAYNYPLSLAIAKIGPALAAGCTVVLMPSPQAPLTTLMIGEAAREAGLPDGVLNAVVGSVDRARQLTTHRDVAKVTFTGSVPVGAQVLHQAADTIKSVTLELGGKSPNLLMPGVDLASVVPNVHLRYLRNAGQGCASPTRLLVHRSQVEEFVDRSREVIGQVPVGDPWLEDTVVGPVISAAHRDRVRSMVDDAVAAGAEVLATGAAGMDNGGYWVAPVLLGSVPPDASVVRQEIFGPVGVMIPYADLDEAIEIANDTDYGLAANIYTDDADGARALAARIQAGYVTINGGGALRADGAFGGFKMSGLGRELGRGGIMQFLEPQHVQWPVTAG